MANAASWHEVQARKPAMVMSICALMLGLIGLHIAFFMDNPLLQVYVSGSFETIGTSEGAQQPSERARNLAVVTVLRDFGDELTSASQDLFDAYSNNRTELIRMQMLHISALAREVANLNENLGHHAADLVVISGGGLLRKETRFVLHKGARIEIVDGGHDMRALWSLDQYEHRMRPILALWTAPDAARFFADQASKGLAGDKYLRFAPDSLDACTTRIISGYADAVSTTSGACFLQDALEKTPDAVLLAGSQDDGYYTLPVEVAWTKDAMLTDAGRLARWLYGQLEVLDAKACAKDLQVSQMSEVARNQVSETKNRPAHRSGRYSNQALVMKTHLFTDRVNKTLHSWARSLNKEGGEVIAAVLGNGRQGRLFDQFKAEHTREDAISYSLMHVDNVGVSRHVIPYEAVDAYDQTCSTKGKEVLCDRDTGGFNHEETGNTNRLMWLFTYANSMSIFKEMLESRPDLEYLWLVDYDVTFTGDLSILFDAVQHDDADMLAVSFHHSASNPEDVLSAEKKKQGLSRWSKVAHFWRPNKTSHHVCTGLLRLSRRMLHWALEVAFQPLNWSVDEVFFYDVCDTFKPACKFTPFNLFDVVNPRGVRTYQTAPQTDFASSLMDSKKGARARNMIWHAIKEDEVLKPVEPWLDV
ncbi:Hypothetical Protein FCC1311_078962 [Hondaea fermentalgiana]|uniref:Uncharacterized protein n=1 Tax=Hondaea fermentalgiana TaxID=2315210 RepID=A0A2R5GTF6_9STRA|nr:Hypothetical Protein FCC1311_078962 [Hondaea fermentalgiana]|eukprot:GBG31671.1 Hypothetical Protein FCC1311_078962 [Hondaea fermentalgiana]